MNNIDEFLTKLADLMEEYNVEFDVEESRGYDSYPEAICICTNYMWDDKGNTSQNREEVKVGTICVEAGDIRNQIGEGREVM